MLLPTLRIWLVAAGNARLTLETLQLRLLEIGGRVRELAISEPLWHLLAAH